MALVAMNDEIDIRHVLPAIRVPTLLLHSVRDLTIPIGASRYMAERIPGARLVELPGEDHLPWLSDVDAILGEIEEFLTGMRRSAEPDRVLATVLFTDIVGATEKAASLGDRRWRDLLDGHNAVVRRELARFRGREVNTAGDGFFAAFDGPARAIRCACAVSQGMRPLGLEVALASTLASARSWAMTWVGSRCILAHASRRWRGLRKCWCRARSRTWSPAPT